MRVEVVDNDSRDGTVEMVAREYPDRLLTVNRQRRVRAANNLALRASARTCWRSTRTRRSPPGRSTL